MDEKNGAFAEGVKQASPEAIRMAEGLAYAADRMIAAHARGGDNGRVVAVPVLKHKCAPGWRTETAATRRI